MALNLLHRWRDFKLVCDPSPSALVYWGSKAWVTMSCCHSLLMKQSHRVVCPFSSAPWAAGFCSLTHGNSSVPCLTVSSCSFSSFLSLSGLKDMFRIIHWTVLDLIISKEKPGLVSEVSVYLSVLVKVTLAVMKHHNQKKWKSWFVLCFQTTVHHSRTSGQELKQGRHLEEGADVEVMEGAAHWLASPGFLCFLRESRTTSPRMASPTMANPPTSVSKWEKCTTGLPTAWSYGVSLLSSDSSLCQVNMTLASTHSLLTKLCPVNFACVHVLRVSS